jgi:hypothetical protein
MHTAEILPDITVFPLTVTFNCTNPASGTTEVYKSPGTFTKPDPCQNWVSATILSTELSIGQTAEIDLGGELARVAAELAPGDPKHIIVRIRRI